VKAGNATNILPESVSPLINGAPTTESVDRDKDGYGLADKEQKLPRYGEGEGTVLLNATETVTHGDKTSLVIAAGGAFMSNFEIKVDLDNAGSLQYSNYTILNNLLKTIGTVPKITVSTIADAKTLAPGSIVTLEGTATASVNTQSTNPDSNKGFFDCIYMQDATGGINLFPVSEGVFEGQNIRVTGTLSNYQGEVQLAVSKVTVLDQTIQPVKPTKVATALAGSPANTGLLIQTQGTVSNMIAEQNGTVNQFTIDDGSGPMIVYINGYITTGGSKVTKDTVLKSAKAHALYARWTANKYTITYNANGGKIGKVKSSKKSVTFAAKYALPATPKRAGYTFKGWYTTSKTKCGTKVTTATKLNTAKAHTLYARWAKK
jgi:uncharacterized repeat protein (TIGR02543 family)